jgi:hypothetical protein
MYKSAEFSFTSDRFLLNFLCAVEILITVAARGRRIRSARTPWSWVKPSSRFFHRPLALFCAGRDILRCASRLKVTRTRYNQLQKNFKYCCAFNGVDRIGPRISYARMDLFDALFRQNSYPSVLICISLAKANIAEGGVRVVKAEGYLTHACVPSCEPDPFNQVPASS